VSACASATALDGFSLDSADSFETAFTRYIQFLASAACDPDFIPSVLDDQDPYFMPALARIDADVTVRKESVASNAWEPEFRVRLARRGSGANGTIRGSNHAA